MLRVLILSALVAGLFSSQAESKTVRYEFDIVDSEIDYSILWRDGAISVDRVSHEYADFVTAFHPLGNLVGWTGHVAFQIQDTSPYDQLQAVTCLSGPLCPTAYYSYSFNDSGGFSIYAGPHVWILKRDTLRFWDDGLFSGYATMNFTDYHWVEPGARFSLANLTMTEIMPVPLPAGAPLLAVGVMALGIGTRRRARAA